MEKCSRCGRTGEEVKLFDGIYVNDSVRICEKCSLIAGIPIIKRPSTEQLRDSERPYGVRTRLLRMNHLESGEKKEKSSFEKLKELESRPDLERPEDLVFKLVDNFHWIIQTERRRKGFTTGQLAASISESESAIKLLEKGMIPSKSLDLIRALEQFLKVRLIKRDIIDALDEKKREDDKVSSFILQKKSEIIKKQESSVLGLAKPAPNFSPGQYRSKTENRDSKMQTLQRQSENIDKDFSYNRKTKEEVGREQVESIGKEDTAYIQRSIRKEQSKSGAPSIYDLMKKKEEKDKSMLGKDIEVLEDKPKSLE
jgi:ribosome-binding protein aMBF1 (putative translation factor)